VFEFVLSSTNDIQILLGFSAFAIISGKKAAAELTVTTREGADALVLQFSTSGNAKSINKPQKP